MTFFRPVKLSVFSPSQIVLINVVELLKIRVKACGHSYETRGLALEFTNWANGSRKPKLAQEKSNWLKPTKSTTFRIYCDSIITRTLCGFQIFSQYNVWNCQQMIAVYTMQTENRTPCVFPSQVWHQLIVPEAVSTGHSIYNAYVIGDHV